MSFFARLFGRNRHKPDQIPVEGTLGDADAPVNPMGVTANGMSQADVDVSSEDQSRVEATMQRAMAPVVAELQALRHMIGTLARPSAAGEPSSSDRQPGGQASSVVAAVDRATIELAIEHALAHFYQLLRGHEAFQTQPVVLTPTADGNTALPLDPLLQHLLVVMHPLYPHMYTTLIVLPGTFTRVDRLGTLPNGVRVRSLHINERKAAPGFMEALRALHRENSDNLFLGTLTALSGGSAAYQLEYFRCTGSEIRNPDAEQFPGEQMMYFNDVPEPLIFRQHSNGEENVFSALADLMQNAASPAASTTRESQQPSSEPPPAYGGPSSLS